MDSLFVGAVCKQLAREHVCFHSDYNVSCSMSKHDQVDSCLRISEHVLSPFVKYASLSVPHICRFGIRNGSQPLGNLLQDFLDTKNLEHDCWNSVFCIEQTVHYTLTRVWNGKVLICLFVASFAVWDDLLGFSRRAVAYRAQSASSTLFALLQFLFFS